MSGQYCWHCHQVLYVSKHQLQKCLMTIKKKKQSRRQKDVWSEKIKINAMTGFIHVLSNITISMIWSVILHSGLEYEYYVKHVICWACLLNIINVNMAACWVLSRIWGLPQGIHQWVETDDRLPRTTLYRKAPYSQMFNPEVKKQDLCNYLKTHFF